MIKVITVYQACDGSRFDLLHEAEDYEKRLKNAAIRSLCNHQYDEWEDYIFNQQVIWFLQLKYTSNAQGGIPVGILKFIEELPLNDYLINYIFKLGFR